jgi:uncharacterized membrane protein YoaK (UPF0700 family)
MPQPGTQKGYGPLPCLLLALTFVTGLVDAVSFFRLDHVFVSNMTGNVLFLAFAVADAKEFSISASSLALASFITGAVTGGRCAKLCGPHRARYLALVMSINIAALVAAAVLAFLFLDAGDALPRYVLIALLGVAMGNQSAAARRLGVPDLNTTVLTQTLTGLASESRLAGGGQPRAKWRLASVVSMFAGAAVGATLVLQIETVMVIGLALLIVLAVAAVALRFRKSADPWTAGAA